MVDINCDMGEGMDNDALIMPYITSANIACGYHAGNEAIARQTIVLALKYHVKIGAHPSFDDPSNFGRVEMQLSSTEIYNLVSIQLKFMHDLATEAGALLCHVKPHGALYNMSAKDQRIAESISMAVKDFDAGLILFGLSGSVSITAANNLGLRTASEVFADRTYQDNGTLTSRKETGAMIDSVEDCISQVALMVNKGLVKTVTGNHIPIVAETICVHGDGSHALQFVKAISAVVK
jgi:5-oxoprolinase (ATP-hydrolysing) subunit A